MKPCVLQLGSCRASLSTRAAHFSSYLVAVMFASGLGVKSSFRCGNACHTCPNHFRAVGLPVYTMSNPP